MTPHVRLQALLSALVPRRSGMRKMGVFTQPLELAARLEGPYRRFEAVVDSRAFYTQLPASVLRELGVEPFDTAAFQLADGRVVHSELGNVLARIGDRTRQTICVFAEEGTPAILGAYTLEAFLLGVDPVNKRLIPVVGTRLRSGALSP